MTKDKEDKENDGVVYTLKLFRGVPHEVTYVKDNMNNKNNESNDMNTELNKLIMVDHPERGIWYFTSINKAAVWIGIQPAYMHYCLSRKNHNYKDYVIDWVDGSNVMYKYINPER